MKKQFITLFTFLSGLIYSQSTTKSFTSTAPFNNTDLLQNYNAIRLMGTNSNTQSAQTNSLLTDILNKIDTTTKIFNVTYTLTSVSSYSANRTIIGNRASTQFTINLGSQYWKLTSVFVNDYGANFGANPRIWIFRDTVNINDNSLIGGGSQRVNRIVAYYNNNTPIDVPTSPALMRHFPVWQISTLPTTPIVTGVITILPTTSAASWAGLNQVINIRCLFEKVKY